MKYFIKGFSTALLFLCGLLITLGGALHLIGSICVFSELVADILLSIACIVCGFYTMFTSLYSVTS